MSEKVKKDLEASVNEDIKTEAEETLEKAIAKLESLKNDLNKAETPAEPENEEETQEEVTADLEKAKKMKAKAKKAKKVVNPYEDDEDEEDMEKGYSLQDVEEGRVNADEFLEELIERQDRMEKAIMTLAESNKSLVEDLQKSNDTINKMLSASIDGSLALAKSTSKLENYFLKQEFNPVTAPKMAGKEGEMLQKAEPVVKKEDKKELSVGFKNKLYKARFVDGLIDHEEYVNAKETGILPESLQK